MKRPVLGLAIVATTAASITAIATHHHRHVTGVGAANALAPVIPLTVRANRAHVREPLPLVKSRPHPGKGAPMLRILSRSARPAGGNGTLADGLNWHGLALCESTDNPRAVDPSRTYFGLYQFDLETWQSVGGTGNPADASRAEQTLRARILYGQRGRAPWPVCGGNL